MVRKQKVKESKESKKTEHFEDLLGDGPEEQELSVSKKLGSKGGQKPANFPRRMIRGHRTEVTSDLYTSISNLSNCLFVVLLQEICKKVQREDGQDWGGSSRKAPRTCHDLYTLNAFHVVVQNDFSGSDSLSIYILYCIYIFALISTNNCTTYQSSLNMFGTKIMPRLHLSEQSALNCTWFFNVTCATKDLGRWRYC